MSGAGRTRVFEGAGIRTERHGEIMYVYLDTPLAVRLAHQLLPPTQRKGVAADGREVWAYRLEKEGT